MYRTVGELRAEVLARLGMGGMGASGGANQALIDSFLRNAQSQLYWMQDWKRLTRFEDATTGAGQSEYDYPEACERDQRVLRVEVLVGGRLVGLHEGIEAAHWSTMDSQGPPARYERMAQLVVWPKADGAYTLRTWFVADLGRFTQNGDRATLDDELILLHAIAAAKAHYRQPDAQLYQGQLDTQLARLRGQSFGNGSVYRRAPRRPDCDLGAASIVVERGSAPPIIVPPVLDVAPSITLGPVSAAVAVGATAIFLVIATGSVPLTYQWRRNGLPIPGATSASFATAAATLGDNGAVFDVVVSNAAGSVVSTGATLTVAASALAGQLYLDSFQVYLDALPVSLDSTAATLAGRLYLDASSVYLDASLLSFA